MIRALLIASTPNLRTTLHPYLHLLAVELFTATSLSQARRLIPALEPVVVIIDRELMEEDGLDIVKDAVKGGAHTVVVSDRHETADRVVALKSGADEYFAKPVDPEELYLRVSKLLGRRRAAQASKSVVHEFAGVKIDLASRAILDPLGNPGPELTESELAVLRELAEHVGQVVERAALYSAMAGVEPLDKSSRAIDTCVSRLRIKLKHADKGIEIRSLRQVGYVLRREGSAQDILQHT